VTLPFLAIAESARACQKYSAKRPDESARNSPPLNQALCKEEASQKNLCANSGTTPTYWQGLAFRDNRVLEAARLQTALPTVCTREHLPRHAPTT